MENLTSGNTGLIQNASDIGSQNTSVTGGMEQEQEATEATSPASTQQKGNQTGEGRTTEHESDRRSSTNRHESDRRSINQCIEIRCNSEHITGRSRNRSDGCK